MKVRIERQMWSVWCFIVRLRAFTCHWSLALGLHNGALGKHKWPSVQVHWEVNLLLSLIFSQLVCPMTDFPDLKELEFRSLFILEALYRNKWAYGLFGLSLSLSRFARMCVCLCVPVHTRTFFPSKKKGSWAAEVGRPFHPCLSPEHIMHRCHLRLHPNQCDSDAFPVGHHIGSRTAKRRKTQVPSLGI